VGNDRVLHRDQQVLGFSQPQPQCVRRQRVAVEGEHLPDHRRGPAVIVGVRDHLQR
jgi:hypothetical protein